MLQFCTFYERTAALTALVLGVPPRGPAVGTDPPGGAAESTGPPAVRALEAARLQPESSRSDEATVSCVSLVVSSSHQKRSGAPFTYVTAVPMAVGSVCLGVQIQRQVHSRWTIKTIKVSLRGTRRI